MTLPTIWVSEYSPVVPFGRRTGEYCGTSGPIFPHPLAWPFEQYGQPPMSQADLFLLVSLGLLLPLLL